MSVRGQTLSFSWELSRRGTQSNRAPKKFVTFWEEEERRQPQRAKRVLCCKAVLTSGPPMMSKTVLDLLHSLGVEDDMIMFDNFGG